MYANRPLISFTDFNKMSPSLVELRVDYHLNRIMKSYRLNNFANAIKALPLQSRICEKLIEILTSSENLIDRKLGKIKEGKEMLDQLAALAGEMGQLGDEAVKDKLASFWDQFKILATSIEQITWALNSNKEHLRYVARIHVVPEVYKRSEEEHIRMKDLFSKIVEDCDEVIDICRSIRLAFEIQLRAIYGQVVLGKPN